MFIESKYRQTPVYGIITKEGKKFDHCELFKGEIIVNYLKENYGSMQF